MQPNTGVAARRLGLKTTLIGIEGDESHIGFAREACAANGFRPDAVALHHGIAGAAPGPPSSPARPRRASAWGWSRSSIHARGARASGRYDELPLVGLETLAEGHERRPSAHRHPGRRGGPACPSLTDKGPVVTVDGVQGWRNPGPSAV